MMEHKRPTTYILKDKEIQDLVLGMGYCYASKCITIDGMKVGYMYRETPESPTDSGWRFFSGTESQEEIDNPEYVEIYDVNTIANYDVTIIPYLHSESDTAFERIECKNDFRIVKI